jgi:hypothetical protein
MIRNYSAWDSRGCVFGWCDHPNTHPCHAWASIYHASIAFIQRRSKIPISFILAPIATICIVLMTTAQAGCASHPISIHRMDASALFRSRIPCKRVRCILGWDPAGICISNLEKAACSTLLTLGRPGVRAMWA